jgi:hypothetical protein
VRKSCAHDDTTGNDPRTSSVAAPVRIRALLRLHGDAFVRGPAAILFVLVIVLAVVLSPSGLDPHDVPRMLRKGSFSRAIALLVLIGLMRGSTQRVILPPGATYLRASAIPRWTQMLAIAGFAAFAQAPLPFVLAVGGAPLDALSGSPRSPPHASRRPSPSSFSRGLSESSPSRRSRSSSSRSW